MTGLKKESKIKRLTPKADVLRELYLLSGNNCAMPDCNNVIIDSAGVVVGHVCHIEAAMPNGPRFNVNHTNEQRRSLSNLVLFCSGHHAQIDSKQYEKKWTTASLQKIKEKHEKNFRGVGDSLKRAFDVGLFDSTDSLLPKPAKSFAEFERLLPDCTLDTAKDVRRRIKDLDILLNKMACIPENERNFMASVIRRAYKLGENEIACVHVDDLSSAFKLPHSKIKNYCEALSRYGVGDLGQITIRDVDEYHVIIDKPSEYVTWFDICRFCALSKHDLDEFVLRLNFSLLDQN